MSEFVVQTKKGSKAAKDGGHPLAICVRSAESSEQRAEAAANSSCDMAFGPVDSKATNSGSFSTQNPK